MRGMVAGRPSRSIKKLDAKYREDKRKRGRKRREREEERAKEEEEERRSRRDGRLSG